MIHAKQENRQSNPQELNNTFFDTKKSIDFYKFFALLN